MSKVLQVGDVVRPTRSGNGFTKGREYEVRHASAGVAMVYNDNGDPRVILRREYDKSPSPHLTRWPIRLISEYRPGYFVLA